MIMNIYSRIRRSPTAKWRNLSKMSRGKSNKKRLLVLGQNIDLKVIQNKFLNCHISNIYSQLEIPISKIMKVFQK